MAERARGRTLKRIAACGGALLICPCHVLYGGAALVAATLGYVAPSAPAIQDGLHALYLGVAGLGAALWLRRAAKGGEPDTLADGESAERT